MRLALVLGSQGEKVKPRLRNIKDNLQIDSYVSIPAYIDNCIKRGIFYDRVVVLSTLTNSVSLNDLHKYWGDCSRDTEIVFLCKDGTDNNLAKEIMGIFVSTKISTMLVKGTTVQILSEAILLPTITITERYGIEKYLSVGVGDNGVDFSIPEEQTKEEVPVVKVEKPQEQKVKKEKRSFLGVLFGGKKGKRVEQQVEENSQILDNTEVSTENLDMKNNVDYDTMQSEYTDEVQSSVQDDDFEPSTPSENLEINVPNASSDHQKEEVSKNLHIMEEDSDLDADSVDLDLGDLTVDTDVNNPIIRGNMNGITEEVDEEADTLGEYEGEYRTSGDQPKVVTKVVTKEIVRHIGGTVNTTLNGILNGKLNKTIVVTGDRGSGVTVTAYSLAREFAKKVPVLYVDFDIERKGILSYIDYETFAAYDTTMREGVKRCRDTSVFQNYIVQYDTNIDILTSDYSCECNDSDISKAQEVVAENAMSYSVVIIDCPMDKLYLIPDLILTGNTVLCMECSKRGVMNMLCGLENSSLELRYKRTIAMRGTLLVTKLNSRVSSSKVLSYANSIFQADGCDWLGMTYKDFNGKLTNDILTEIVEG